MTQRKKTMPNTGKPVGYSEPIDPLKKMSSPAFASRRKALAPLGRSGFVARQNISTKKNAAENLSYIDMAKFFLDKIGVSIAIGPKTVSKKLYHKKMLGVPYTVGISHDPKRGMISALFSMEDAYLRLGKFEKFRAETIKILRSLHGAKVSRSQNATSFSLPNSNIMFFPRFDGFDRSSRKPGEGSPSASFLLSFEAKKGLWYDTKMTKVITPEFDPLTGKVKFDKDGKPVIKKVKRMRLLKKHVLDVDAAYDHFIAQSDWEISHMNDPEDEDESLFHGGSMKNLLAEMRNRLGNK